jgi:hypothetical protein
VHRILGVRYGLPPFQGGAAPVGCGRQRRRRFRTALQIIHLGRRTFLLLQLACVARTGRRLASPLLRRWCCRRQWAQLRRRWVCHLHAGDE